MRNTTLLALAALASMTSVAAADPKLVVTAVANDLAASGNTVVGWIYDSAAGYYAPYKYTRGIGFTRVTGAAPGGGSGLLCSGDGSILASAMDNVTNWGSLNCFTGYDANGNPRTATNPCSTPPPSITNRYTAAGGWVNAGSFTRYPDPTTGRMIGGTRCDYSINSPNDISANGRYIVGGAWSAVATNSAGNPALGLCGDFFAFNYDSQTGIFQKLPTTSRTTLANHVSGDGSVVTGYDLNASTSQRRTAVWTNGVETILDDAMWKDAPVNGPGTAIAAGPSPAYCFAQFQSYLTLLVKWTRSGNAWVPQNLGTPTDWIDQWGTPNSCNMLIARGISDDGNTIVGDAYYGGDNGQTNGTKRLFIWKAGVNEGVPMDLQDYLATLDPSGEKLAGAGISSVYGLSADGNTLLVAGGDTRQPCETGYTLSTFLSGMLAIDGSAVGNEPPTIAMQPADMTTACPWPMWGEVMNVTAGGSWPLNYQWQREDPNLPGTWVNLVSSCSASAAGQAFPPDASWEYEGVNGPQLRVNVVNQDTLHNGRYRCVITNTYGAVTSNPGTLTFTSPGAMNPQTPQPATGCANSPATFTVGDVAGVEEYRWEICTSPENDTWAILSDGTNTFSIGSMTVSGTRTPTMTITPGTLQAGNTYQFRCHLAWSCGTLNSNPGDLTIGSPCGLADVGAQGGIPAPCGDGVLDNNDFVVFIDYFFASNPIADMGIQGGIPGHDGQWDNNDFIVFIDYFFGGCN